METRPSPEEILQRRTGHHPFLFQGNSTGVLLIHGLTGTAEEMRYLGDRLNRDLGFTVSGVLLAGHGQDFLTFQEYGWQDWHQSVKAGLLDLLEACDPLFVVGFSMGGLLAILLALEFGDRIRALALLSTPLFVNRHRARLASHVWRLPGIKTYLTRRAQFVTPEQSPLRQDLAPPPGQFHPAQMDPEKKGGHAESPHPVDAFQAGPVGPMGKRPGLEPNNQQYGEKDDSPISFPTRSDHRPRKG